MTATAPRSRRLLSGLLLLMIIGGVVYEGADRDPADPTRPLVYSRYGIIVQDLPPKTPPLTSEELTVVSFNIHSGKGTDGVTDLNRISKLLEGCNLAGLYEVRNPVWGKDQSAQIAELIYSDSWFAATERHWYHEHFGNALLSRVAVTDVQRLPLPGTRGKAFRNAILAYIPWQDQTLKVLAVHIDREQDRERQLKLVTQLFQALEAPAILMGDLNTTIDDPLLQSLRTTPGVQSPLHDTMGDTVPAGTIDWMFTKGLSTVSAELLENEASDHPALKVRVRLPENSNSQPSTLDPQPVHAE